MRGRERRREMARVKARVRMSEAEGGSECQVMARVGVNVAGPLSPPCVLMSLSLALSFCEEPVLRGCCSCSFHALRGPLKEPGRSWC